MNEDVRSTVEPGFIHRRLKFPLLEREDRVALAERVNKSSPADFDFIMMMTLASVLASLGLMQGSTAVVIGAMLVAPLMGPLLGAGLAVTQGNLKLFRDASIAIAIGVGIGLVVSLGVGLLNPGYEPSLEIEARVMSAMLLTAPLFLNMLKETQRGQDRPLNYPVAPVVRNAMQTYLEDHPEIEIITIARSSVEPERGIGVLLKSDTEIGPTFVEEVQTLVRRARGEMIPVEVHVLRSAEAR